MCDIAQGVSDGLDGLILSAETASGLFPLEATSTVTQICYDTEQQIDFISQYQQQQGNLKTWMGEQLAQNP